MRKAVLALLSLALLLLLLAAGPALAEGEGPVVVLQVRGIINPLTARYLERTMTFAERQAARLIVLMLDTPGGLDSAMRDMVQMLLQSRIPTVVFVAPPGARATSAGMFITLAADVAAMSPATHIGAAHPVPLGVEISDVMEEKITSDAAALVRSIAAQRGRNVEWAELAVRESVSVTAEEALQTNIIEYIASDLDDLLGQLDGQVISTPRGDVRLRTQGAPLERRAMNLIEQMMQIISDPNIAYLLLSVATLFLLAELADPGLSVPGIASAVCFILAFLALGSLPINWAGVALLVLGVLFFVVGIFTDLEAIVTLAGLVPFVIGSLILFSPFSPSPPAAPDLRVSPWAIAAVSLAIVGFSFLVLKAIVAVARMPARSGAQRLVGQQGLALSDLAPEGQVRVDLQDWSAVAMDRPIRAGETIQVVGLAGVRLQVTKVRPEKEAGSSKGGT